MSDAAVAEVAAEPTVIGELGAKFGDDCQFQTTADGIPTAWVPAARIVDVMRFLKTEVESPYPMLFDLSAIDERLRQHRGDQPECDFTVFYHLLSLERNEDLRIKVAVPESAAALPSVTSVWPVANWYEREAFRHVRVGLRGASESAPDSDTAPVGGPPAAQGSSGAGHRTRAVQHERRVSSRAAGEPALRPGRVGDVAGHETHRFHVPEFGPQPPERARRVPHCPAIGRRGRR